MTLILTYFDGLLGPNILISYPDKLEKTTENTIKSLLDIKNENDFFEFNVKSNEPISIFNLKFNLNSEWARGKKEIVMLSVIAKNRFMKPIIENILREMHYSLKNRTEIYKAFYYFMKKSPETQKEFNALKIFIKTNYMKLEMKKSKLHFVDNLFLEKQIDKNSKTSDILQTLARTFITCIDARIPEGAFLLYEIGEILANKFQNVFDSTEIDGLLNELSKFWKKHKFGEIDDIRYDPNKGLDFNVYGCFECAHLDNINQTVCKFDEGFLTRLMNHKLEKSYRVKELECIATGKSYCKFNIQKTNILE